MIIPAKGCAQPDQYQFLSETEAASLSLKEHFDIFIIRDKGNPLEKGTEDINNTETFYPYQC